MPKSLETVNVMRKSGFAGMFKLRILRRASYPEFLRDSLNATTNVLVKEVEEDYIHRRAICNHRGRH